MKRHIIGLCTFIAALSIGFIAALVSWSDASVDKAEVQHSAPEVVIAAEELSPKKDLEIIEEIDSYTDLERNLSTKLLITGSVFHGDEVNAKNGEKWLGAFEDNGQVYLRETRLKIKRVYDDIIDYPNEKGRSGKSVGVTDPSTPLFLVRNADFPQGNVPTVFLGKTWNDIDKPEFSELAPIDILTTLTENYSQSLEFEGVSYQIKVVRARNSKLEDVLALTIEADGNRQVLHTLPANANTDVGTLYWIGDIDRDGKPDIYLDLFVHYNIGNRVLFVSGEADQGKLLKKVAYFWTTGC